MQKNIVESSDIVNHAVNQFHDFFSSESKVLVFTLLRLSEQFHENSVKQQISNQNSVKSTLSLIMNHAINWFHESFL